MKTCPVCSLDLEDSYLFCPEDGSSLGAPADDELAAASARDESAGDLESTGAVVLYCPTCAAEYPLTFSECPVHGLQLTRHKIPRPAREPANALAIIKQARTEQPVKQISNRLTSLDLERPQIERFRPVRVDAAPPGDDPQQVSREREIDFDNLASDASTDNNPEFNQREFLADVPEQERPGFRVAAIATVILLSVLGLTALYSFVSHLSRKSSPSAMRVANQPEAAQLLPFVPTPQEAQDYNEPQPTPAASSAPEPRAESRVERKRDDAGSSSSTRRGVLDTTATQPTAKPVSTPATPRMTSASLPPLPRGNSDGFDARLVRVRSMKTASGVRYDLTFNMQEQAGRSAQWQRLLVTSRSANGINRSQAIPFAHRLGATGALTFTISVEMTGRSESDWQGRVVCTTLGWDNKDRPLQASFGANVTP